MITIHDCGFVEIETNGQMLLLTSEEYEKARRRGSSVVRNRVLNRLQHSGRDIAAAGREERITGATV